MDRGHDVTVLEASGRPGGHVRTIHDPLPDGLYADVGAEHFTKPATTSTGSTSTKFNLPALPYPRRVDMLRRIDGKWYTEEQLQDPKVLRSFGFNAREVDFIVKHGWTELPLLYFGPYLDAIKDEYQPFGAGLDQLDEITAGELLAKDGASDAALRFNGLRRGDGSQAARNSDVSALFRIWQQAIVKRRGLPVFKREVFRLKGGNQLMTDTFAARLGERLRLGCPITAIEHGDSGGHGAIPGVRRAEDARGRLPRELHPAGHPQEDPGDARLARVEAFVIDNVVFSSQSRVLLQSRTPFWKGDVPSINLETGDPAMYLVYETADEVPGDRGVLMGSGKPDVTADEALAAFRRFYPGKSHTIEQAYRPQLGEGPVGVRLRADAVPAGTAQEILAADPRAGRPDPLRRLVRRQPALGHGRRHPLGQSRGGDDRSSVGPDDTRLVREHLSSCAITQII